METILNNVLVETIGGKWMFQGGGRGRERSQTDRQTNADCVTKCIIRNADQHDSAFGPQWTAGAAYTWLWRYVPCALFESECSNSAQCQQTAT